MKRQAITRSSLQSSIDKRYGANPFVMKWIERQQHNRKEMTWPSSSAADFTLQNVSPLDVEEGMNQLTLTLSNGALITEAGLIDNGNYIPFSSGLPFSGNIVTINHMCVFGKYNIYVRNGAGVVVTNDQVLDVRVGIINMTPLTAESGSLTTNVSVTTTSHGHITRWVCKSGDSEIALNVLLMNDNLVLFMPIIIGKQGIWKIYATDTYDRVSVSSQDMVVSLYRFVLLSPPGVINTTALPVGIAAEFSGEITVTDARLIMNDASGTSIQLTPNVVPSNPRRCEFSPITFPPGNYRVRVTNSVGEVVDSGDQVINLVAASYSITPSYVSTHSSFALNVQFPVLQSVGSAVATIPNNSVALLHPTVSGNNVSFDPVSILTAGLYTVDMKDKWGTQIPVLIGLHITECQIFNVFPTEVTSALPVNVSITVSGTVTVSSAYLISASTGFSIPLIRAYPVTGSTIAFNPISPPPGNYFVRIVLADEHIVTSTQTVKIVSLSHTILPDEKTTIIPFTPVATFSYDQPIMTAFLLNQFGNRYDLEIDTNANSVASFKPLSVYEAGTYILNMVDTWGNNIPNVPAEGIIVNTLAVTSITPTNPLTTSSLPLTVSANFNGSPTITSARLVAESPLDYGFVLTAAYPITSNSITFNPIVCFPGAYHLEITVNDGNILTSSQKVNIVSGTHTILPDTCVTYSPFNINVAFPYPQRVASAVMTDGVNSRALPLPTYQVNNIVTFSNISVAFAGSYNLHMLDPWGYSIPVISSEKIDVAQIAITQVTPLMTYTNSYPLNITAQLNAPTTITGAKLVLDYTPSLEIPLSVISPLSGSNFSFGPSSPAPGRYVLKLIHASGQEFASTQYINVVSSSYVVYPDTAVVNTPTTIYATFVLNQKIGYAHIENATGTRYNLTPISVANRVDFPPVEIDVAGNYKLYMADHWNNMLPVNASELIITTYPVITFVTSNGVKNANTTINVNMSAASPISSAYFTGVNTGTILNMTSSNISFPITTSSFSFSLCYFTVQDTYTLSVVFEDGTIAISPPSQAFYIIDEMVSFSPERWLPNANNTLIINFVDAYPNVVNATFYDIDDSNDTIPLGIVTPIAQTQTMQFQTAQFSFNKMLKIKVNQWRGTYRYILGLTISNNIIVNNDVYASGQSYYLPANTVASRFHGAMAAYSSTIVNAKIYETLNGAVSTYTVGLVSSPSAWAYLGGAVLLSTGNYVAKYTNSTGTEVIPSNHFSVRPALIHDSNAPRANPGIPAYADGWPVYTLYEPYVATLQIAKDLERAKISHMNMTVPYWVRVSFKTPNYNTAAGSKFMFWLTSSYAQDGNTITTDGDLGSAGGNRIGAGAYNGLPYYATGSVVSVNHTLYSLATHNSIVAPSLANGLVIDVYEFTQGSPKMMVNGKVVTLGSALDWSSTPNRYIGMTNVARGATSMCQYTMVNQLEPASN